MDAVNYALNETSPKAEQPETISLLLKPHQLASLYRMCMIDRDCGMTLKSAGINIRSNVGILADCAGYGKTIVTLAMVDALRLIDTQWMPYAKTFTIENYGVTWTKKREPSKNHTFINTSLIVVPDNLVEHWRYHLDKYTDLEYEIVDDTNHKRMIVDDYDAILCPARHYNLFVRQNNEYYWNRVIYDEADSIHLPNTEYINARFIWLVTATYDNIPKRKNKGFLTNLFKSPISYEDVINEYFYPVVIKGADEFVKKSFSLIEPDVQYITCVAPKYVNAVRNHISQRVLELINAGDLNGAILSLGGDVDSDRNILELVTRGIKNDITMTEKKLEGITNLDLPLERKLDKQEQLEKKLESLHTRKDSLEKSIAEANDSDCAICCDKLEHPTLTPCCNNMFCAGCLLSWMKSNSTCPMCRSKFDIAELKTIGKNCRKRPMRRIIKKDKTSVLINIIKNNPTGKHIVFSGHSITFNEICKILKAEDISYGVLTTTLNTEKTLNNFRKGLLQVILLDAENNGAGLEIQEATDVILYHELRKSLEIQTIARAQRPGRSGQLRVWKLKYNDEYSRL